MNFLLLIFLVVCVQSPLVGSGRNEIADNFIIQIGRLHFDGKILKEFVDGCSCRLFFFTFLKNKKNLNYPPFPHAL